MARSEIPYVVWHANVSGHGCLAWIYVWIYSYRQISYSLAHLLSIIEHLEPAWNRALLSRTRFNDPNFQGDVLSVISTSLHLDLSTVMFTSIKTWYLPLSVLAHPYRKLRHVRSSTGSCSSFMDWMLYTRRQKMTMGYRERWPKRRWRMNSICECIVQIYSEHRSLTYLFPIRMFCVGVSTAFGIVGRLDRLMVAAKEIVGEQYHIKGLGFGGSATPHATFSSMGVPMGSRTSTRMRWLF